MAIGARPSVAADLVEIAIVECGTPPSDGVAGCVVAVEFRRAISLGERGPGVDAANHDDDQDYASRHRDVELPSLHDSVLVVFKRPGNPMVPGSAFSS